MVRKIIIFSIMTRHSYSSLTIFCCGGILFLLWDDNFLHGHTLYREARNKKEQKRKREKGKGKKNHLQLLLYFFRSSGTTKSLTGNRQWKGTCMFKESVRCFWSQGALPQNRTFLVGSAEGKHHLKVNEWLFCLHVTPMNTMITANATPFLNRGATLCLCWNLD